MDVEAFGLHQVGQEDGESVVEMEEVKVVCNGCRAEYNDKESIEMARKWIVEGYAPCPNISCRGQLEIKQVK